MRESLLKISYNMELSEIGEGFKLFYKKYQMKRSIIFTIVYGIATILGIDMIIRNWQNFYGYLLVGIGVGLIFMQWYRPVAIRKKLIATLSSMSQESYETEIFNDKLTITTIVAPEETVVVSESGEKAEVKEEEKASDETDVEGSEYSEDAENSESETVVSTFYFGSDLMEAMENDDMFLLFVNKSLIYIYPKRCLTEEEQNTLRDIFTDKAIL